MVAELGEAVLVDVVDARIWSALRPYTFVSPPQSDAFFVLRTASPLAAYVPLRACHGPTDMPRVCPLSLYFQPSLPTLQFLRNRSTYTEAAHLVTLLPSFKQSSSPLPLLSVLHFIKSSLNSLHLAPIKKLALSSGADEAPSSGTAGMDSGRGVVSTRTDWENLGGVSLYCPGCRCASEGN